MKQYEAVIETMLQLGGVATLAELNKEVFKFLSYDALVKQYEMEQEKQTLEFIL